MEKVSRVKLAWRMAAITIVLAFAFIGICSEPTGMVNAKWWMVFCISKLIGTAFATLAVYLFNKWQFKEVFDN